MKGITLERVNFLVVDDNRHTRKLVSGILRGLGARNVFLAASAGEALDEMHVTPIDIAIVDWEMEILTGVEFVKMVRTENDSPDPFLPVIMLTANTRVKHVEEARDAGANEYLAKPVSPEALYRRIVSIIEHSRRFVRTETFFGPDRRRRTGVHKGSERRKSRTQAANSNAKSEDQTNGRREL